MSLIYFYTTFGLYNYREVFFYKKPSLGSDILIFCFAQIRKQPHHLIHISQSYMDRPSKVRTNASSPPFHLAPQDREAMSAWMKLLQFPTFMRNRFFLPLLQRNYKSRCGSRACLLGLPRQQASESPDVEGIFPVPKTSS